MKQLWGLYFSINCTLKCNSILYFYSVALVRFSSYPDSQFVLFGVANELHLNPRHVTCGYIYTYKWVQPKHFNIIYLLIYFIVFRVNPTCTSLELVHKTTVDNVPTAICGFQGRVIIGIGRILRLYDIGKKKLLRKCENKVNDTW